MKKLITLTIALFVLGVGNILGQQTQTVSVSATVEAPINITVTNNVVFGTIENAAASLDRESADPNAPVGTNLGSTAALGVLQISGTVSGTTLVDYTDATLSDGATSETTVAFTTAIRDFTNSANIATGDQVALDGSGQAVLHIGGSLAAPGATGLFNTTQGSGSPITVTVQYL